MKQNIFYLLNSATALFTGFFIYVFLKSGTFINSFLGFSLNYFPQSFIGEFVICWFCDFLWAYALIFALYLCLYPFQHKLHISAVCTIIASIVFEVLQLKNIVSGTFDWWDIIIEITAVIIAVVIIKRRNSK